MTPEIIKAEQLKDIPEFAVQLNHPNFSETPAERYEQVRKSLQMRGIHTTVAEIVKAEGMMTNGRD